MFQDNLQAGKFLEDLSGFGLESIKSTIVSDKKDAKKEIKSKKEQKKSEENIQETTQSVNDLDEQTIMENFRKLSQKMKSP